MDSKFNDYKQNNNNKSRFSEKSEYTFCLVNCSVGTEDAKNLQVLDGELIISKLRFLKSETRYNKVVTNRQKPIQLKSEKCD